MYSNEPERERGGNFGNKTRQILKLDSVNWVDLSLHMPSEFSARRGDVSQTLSLSVGGIEIGGLTQHHLLSAHIFSSGHFYGLLLLLAPSRPSYLFIFLLFFSVFFFGLETA